MKTPVMLQYLIQILVLFLLIWITIVFIPILQDYIQTKMQELKQSTIMYLEETIGRNIRYSRISPSLLRFVKIDNLRIYDPQNNEILIEVEELKIYYDLLALIFGDTENIVNEIRISNSSFSINTEEDDEILDFISNLIFPEESGQETALPEYLIISGENIHIEAVHPQGRVEMSNLFFSARITNQSIMYNASSDIDFISEIEEFPIEQGYLDLSMQGETRLLTNYTLATCTIDSLYTNVFQLSEQTFQIEFEDQKLELTKIEDSIPIDITASYNLSQAELESELLFESFSPDTILTFTNQWSPINQWLSVTGSGELGFSLEMDTGEIEYSGNAYVYTGRISSLPFPVEASLDFTGSSDYVYFNQLYADTEAGTINYTGSINLANLSPQGHLVYSGTPVDDMPIYADLQIFPESSGIGVISTDIQVSGLGVDYFSAAGEFHRDSIEFSTSLTISNDTPEHNLIRTEGTFQFSPSPYLETSVEITDTPLFELTNILSEDIMASIQGVDPELSPIINASVFLFSDFSSFSSTSPIFRISDRSTDRKFVQAAITANDTRIVAQNIHMVWEDHEIQGNTRLISHTGTGGWDFSGDFQYEDIDYSFSGAILSSGSAIITGSYGSRAVLFANNSGGWHGNMRIENFPISLSEEGPMLTASLSGSYQGPDDWMIFTNEAIIQFPELFPNNSPMLSFSADINSSIGRIYNVSYIDRHSILTGNGNIFFTSMEEPQIQTWIQLSNAEHNEQIQFFGNINGSTLDTRLELTNTNLAHFGDIPLEGSLNSEMHISGDISSPEIQTEFTIPDATFNNDSVAINGNLSITQDLLQIVSLNAEYRDSVIENAQGTFSFETGDFELISQFNGRVQDAEVTTEIQVQGGFSVDDERIIQFFPEPRGEFTVDLVNLSVAEEMQPGWDFSVKMRPENTTINGGPDDSIQANFQNDNSFSLSFSSPLPIQFNSHGTFEVDTVQADLENVNFNIGFLNEFLNLDFLQLPRGTVQGNLSIEGAVTDPDFFGQLRIQDTLAEIPYSPATLGPINTVLQFSEKQIILETTEVPINNDRVSIEANFLLDHWAPRSYDIMIRSLTQNGIHVDSAFPGIDVDGWGIGDLRLYGDPRHIWVEGDLLVQNCEIQISNTEIAEELPLEEEPVEVNVDLSFTTGRRVEFFWPSTALPIIRTFAATGQEVNLLIDSQNNTFSLTGGVNIQGGEIYYFNRSFYLKEGQIIFNENEERFDPIINVLAELREFRQEQEVRIFLIADQNRLTQFQPRFESPNNLSNMEILSMLGQSLVTQIGGEEIDLTADVLLSSVARAGVDLLGQISYVRAFEERVRDILNLDLFTLRTQVVQNLFLEKLLHNPQTPLDTTTDSLGKYLDNTTLFMGKYIGNDVFFELMLRLQSQSVVESNLFGLTGIEPRLEIGLEWQTPFFLINWSLMPEHPEDLFVTDNELTFSWSYSY
ncbi:MAG: translocation/assembly module TamB domain-containing protein [Spirochaetia bacterium]